MPGWTGSGVAGAPRSVLESVARACRLVDAPVPQPYDALKHVRRLAAGGAGNDSHGHMVARVGSSATISREFRQARKGATVAVTSGAGGVLARAAALTGAGNEAGSGGK